MVAVPGTATAGAAIDTLAAVAAMVGMLLVAPTIVRSVDLMVTAQLWLPSCVSVTVVTPSEPVRLLPDCVRTAVGCVTIATTPAPLMPTVPVRAVVPELALAAVGARTPAPSALAVATARARDLRILGSSRDRRRVGGDYDCLLLKD